jgi:hypothetical protein
MEYEQTYAGGVSCVRGSPTFTNCTITANVADSASEVFCSEYGSPTFTNCILWGNGILIHWRCEPVIAHCDVQGSWPGTGNIDVDPHFVDPDGPDDDPDTWEDNDYRLSAASPCCDAGDNAGVPVDTSDLDGDGDAGEALPFDFTGYPRFIDDLDTPDTGNGVPPIVDIGAYEACWGDRDGDGILDCEDGCPDDPNKTEPGPCGCGIPDTDTDTDGTPDCIDGCPDDPDKTEPGICGCGVPEDACGDSQQSIPGILCPALATLTLTLTLLGLLRMRERAGGSRKAPVHRAAEKETRA